MKEIIIKNNKIGSKYKPFIIAEMSGNHNQSLDRALQIVEAAAKAGADALKIQTYTADTMTLDLATEIFQINDPNSLWKGETLYQLYQKAHTPWEWHETIFNKCQELGMIGFSSPFDATAVDFLETLNVPLYKIASFENIDLPLIKRVAATKKPMIISTGMASVAEINDAVFEARRAGCEQLILLKCTSSYPSDPKNSHLKTIPHMQKLWNCHIGLSDHTPGIGAAIASVALGAVAIEKHFTLDRSEGGVDANFSLEPTELKALVEESKIAHQALGHVNYGLTAAEESSLRFRRSLFIVKDMKAGEKLNRENLRAIRPGFGLAPKYFSTVLGKTILKDTPKGTPLTWELL